MKTLKFNPSARGLFKGILRAFLFKFKTKDAHSKSVTRAFDPDRRLIFVPVFLCNDREVVPFQASSEPHEGAKGIGERDFYIDILNPSYHNYETFRDLFYAK